jgi:hypothetical protein
MPNSASTYNVLEMVLNYSNADDWHDADFSLIKKLYLDGRTLSEIPFKVLDIKRHKLQFLNCKRMWITDIKGQKLGKLLAQNLIRTYMITNRKLTDLVIELKEDERNFLMTEYSMDRLSAHAQSLKLSKNQKKLVQNLATFISSLDKEEVIE